MTAANPLHIVASRQKYNEYRSGALTPDYDKHRWHSNCPPKRCFRTTSRRGFQGKVGIGRLACADLPYEVRSAPRAATPVFVGLRYVPRL